MNYKLDYDTLKSYYRNFTPYSPGKVQLFMVLTLGLYLVHWVYLKNKEFEEYTDEAPDSKRGAALMLVLPFSWLLIMLLVKLILPGSLEFVRILNVSGWLFIMFMILQYLYEFCYLYGAITRTYGMVWYYFIFPGFLALILVPLGFWYTIPLLFFPFACLPAMQGKLNYESTRFSMQHQKNEFYRHEKKFSS